MKVLVLRHSLVVSMMSDVRYLIPQTEVGLVGRVNNRRPAASHTRVRVRATCNFNP